MSLLRVLKDIGKDLSHVGTWIEDGLKAVQPVITAVDPPLGAIITTIETVLGKIQAGTSEPINATTLQAIVTAVAAALKQSASVAATAATPPAA